MIFVDTGAWHAPEVEDEFNHAARKFLLHQPRGTHGVPLTTDYIIDETVTLLRSRRSLGSATSFIEKIRSSSKVRIAWVDESLLEKGLKIFKSDKGM